MIAIVAAFATALVLGLLASYGCRPVFDAPVFTRRNYRDVELPTAMGLVIALVVATCVAVQQLVLELFSSWFRSGSSGWDELSYHGPTLVGLCVGFGLLGLLDDLAGVGESGGFRGHLRAAAHGRITTGMIKLVGGPVVAVAVLGGSLLTSSPLGLLRDAAVVALVANLANLFDRAPGRTIKFGLVCFVLLVAVSRRSAMATPALALGASAALLPGDLAEEFMLGDAGSNVIGAALGFGIVVGTSPTWRWVVLVVAVVANLASEVVSFSKVIDSIGPLRWLDRLGSARGS